MGSCYSGGLKERWALPPPPPLKKGHPGQKGHQSLGQGTHIQRTQQLKAVTPFLGFREQQK